MSVSEILLILFIMNLGTVFGAGIYETRLVLPLWFNKTGDGSYMVNYENMRNIDSGRNFWAVASTGALTLLTIANLVFAIMAPKPLHYWWVAAALLTLIERILTFSYFIPTIIRLFKSEGLPADKISHSVSMWLGVNWIRIGMTIIAMLISFKALIVLVS
jgi:hypothetical protein